jgi:hypothetical protein
MYFHHRGKFYCNSSSTITHPKHKRMNLTCENEKGMNKSYEYLCFQPNEPPKTASATDKIKKKRKEKNPKNMPCFQQNF